MNGNPVSETSSFADRRQVIRRTIGGHEFTITEPGWRTAARAVALYVALVGNREDFDATVRDVVSVMGDASLGDDEKKQRTIQVVLKDEDEIAAMDDSGITELLGMVTDKPAEWYTDDALSFDDMMLLLVEVAQVLPFGRVFGQKAPLKMGFVSAWTSSLAASMRASPGNSGSAGESSDSAGLDGLRVSPEKSESSEARN